ncbi:MAG: right-handed parallel beta-helix repeat-containing protein, partial [bacterium]
MKRTRILLATGLFAVMMMVAAGGVFAQGSLTPSGAPAPNMKSLTQVFDQATSAATTAALAATNAANAKTSADAAAAAANTAALNAANATVSADSATSAAVTAATNAANATAAATAAEAAANAAKDPRTAVNSTNTPGDADASYVISQAGSYYLTGSIVGVSTKHGIQITTAGVTLDLNGFSVIGVAGSLDGIKAEFSVDRAVVKNGIVTSWAGNGVKLHNESLVEGVIASNNGSTGIFVENYCIVRKCEARNNQSVGIWSYGASMIQDCVSANNTYSGIGIDGEGGQVVGCQSHFNGGGGIVANAGGAWLIKDNTCSRNTYSGVDVCYGNTILNNVCYYNGSGAENGYGINVRCGSNRVEGNQCVDNDIGINALSNGNE